MATKLQKFFRLSQACKTAMGFSLSVLYSGHKVLLVSGIAQKFHINAEVNFTMDLAMPSETNGQVWNTIWVHAAQQKTCVE